MGENFIPQNAMDRMPACPGNYVNLEFQQNLFGNQVSGGIAAKRFRLLIRSNWPYTLFFY